MRALVQLEEFEDWQWPPHAGRLIKEALANSEAPLPDRLSAVKLGGSLVVFDDEMCDLLLAVLEERKNPEQLRASAAISLGPALATADDMNFGEFGETPLDNERYEIVQTVLHQLVDNQEEPTILRRRALEASIRSPEDWHAGSIAWAYQQDEPEWKVTAIFAMGWVRGFRKEILESLTHPNPEVSREAVRAASNWGFNEALKPLRDIAFSTRATRDERLAAIEGAANIASPEALEMLRELMEDDDEEISEVAHFALQEATLFEGFEDPFDDDDPFD